MPVHATDRYQFAPRDALANFKGKQLLYVFWDKHLLFSRPMALALHPDTPFSEVVDTHIAEAYNFHPDFASIDWGKVQWIKSAQPWYPDRSKSLADNGLRHKDLIRLVTPGLDGLNGSGG